MQLWAHIAETSYVFQSSILNEMLMYKIINNIETKTKDLNDTMHTTQHAMTNRTRKY